MNGSRTTNRIGRRTGPRPDILAEAEQAEATRVEQAAPEPNWASSNMPLIGERCRAMRQHELVYAGIALCCVSDPALEATMRASANVGRVPYHLKPMGGPQ